jgi:hypothetical protein
MLVRRAEMLAVRITWARLTPTTSQEISARLEGVVARGIGVLRQLEGIRPELRKYNPLEIERDMRSLYSRRESLSDPAEAERTGARLRELLQLEQSYRSVSVQYSAMEVEFSYIASEVNCLNIELTRETADAAVRRLSVLEAGAAAA